jgi:hypothetical protein
MIISYFEGENKTLKEMLYLDSPIHDALKLIEQSIIELNQWVVMGSYE